MGKVEDRLRKVTEKRKRKAVKSRLTRMLVLAKRAKGARKRVGPVEKARERGKVRMPKRRRKSSEM
jgi:hypothetical protein